MRVLHNGFLTIPLWIIHTESNKQGAEERALSSWCKRKVAIWSYLYLEDNPIPIGSMYGIFTYIYHKKTSKCRQI